MTKMTLHTQALPGWLPNFLAVSGAGYVKCVDAFYDPVSNRVYRNASGYDARGIYIYPQLDNVRVIGRTFMPDSDSNALIWQGAAGADTWFNGWWPTYWANPHVWAWEGPNEPQPMADPNFRVQLDLFTSRLADLMQNASLRLVGHNFGVGWPDLGHGPQFAASIAKLHDYGFYLGLHEYSAPEMWDGEGFYCLRYRNLIQELQGAGVPIPQIVIGECGLDGGVIAPPPPYVGWKTLCDNDPACYIEQLLWYETELRKDEEIECASIFTAGAFDPWYDFEMEEGISMTLADELANLPDPSFQEWAKGFLVRVQEGVITPSQWQSAWDAGYRFVDVRASYGTMPDARFAENWANAGAVGFLRAASHWVHPTKTGQAAIFREAVGDRVPELGIYGSLTAEDITLDKCNLFLQASDQNFGMTCNVMIKSSWNLPTNWQAEGRKLNVWDGSGGEVPSLPVGYDQWELWLHAYEQVPPLPVAVYLLRYNGTDADLFAEYAGTEQVIAQLLVAQAKNAEVAAHIATALAMLQGPQ